MPGHTAAHERASKTYNRSRNQGGVKVSGSTKRKTTTTKSNNTIITNKGADDNKVAYLTSTKGRTNAKKAAEIKAKNKIKKDMEDFANLTYQPPKFVPGPIKVVTGAIGEKTFNVNKQYYTRNVIGKTNPKTGQAYAGTVEDFETYMRGRGSGELDAMGRTINRSDNDGGGRVIIEKKIGGSTILTETKTEAEKTAEAKEDAEYDARKTKRRGRRRTILTSQTGATGNLQLSKPILLGV